MTFNATVAMSTLTNFAVKLAMKKFIICFGPTTFSGGNFLEHQPYHIDNHQYGSPTNLAHGFQVGSQVAVFVSIQNKGEAIRSRPAGQDLLPRPRTKAHEQTKEVAVLVVDYLPAVVDAQDQNS
jgi:hypothetical protein